MKIEWNKVTWYSKYLALALFVALPFIGFYFGKAYEEIKWLSSDASILAKSVVKTSYYDNVSEWQTDANNNDFSIAYPIDFQTDDNHSTAPIDDWRIGTTGGQGLKLFTLTIPKVFEPQTNFDEAVLSVGMSNNKKAITDCLAYEIGDGITATSTAMIDENLFIVFHSADAGAGNYYETTSYRTIHNGACYALEYTIHSSQIANYPASYNLYQFDKAKIQDVLDRVVNTFKFSN